MDKRHHIVVLAIALTVLAAAPRFYGLGWLGFYGDEETTAFPARALAEGKGAKMPSGMPYYRALPFTWLNALSARIFGLDREISYRAPAALLGTLTVPLLFLMSRRFLGGTVALLAALLLALSEWHIATSREARMYGPFLFFYVAAALVTLRWTTTGEKKYLLWAAFLFAGSISLHALGILGVIFAIIPIAFMGWARVAPIWLLITAGIAGICAHVYDTFFVSAAFKTWLSGHAVTAANSTTATAATAKSWLPGIMAYLSTWGFALALAGAMLGLWAARRVEPNDGYAGRGLRSAGRYTCAALAGVLACTGQLYAASIAVLVFLYLHPGDRSQLLRRASLPVGLILVIAVVWAATVILRDGMLEGLKNLAYFPFPYPAIFAEMFPVIFLLFVGTLVYLALRSHREEEHGLRAYALAVVLPITAIGVVSRWGGIRYLFEVYPFLLLIAASGLLATVRTVSNAIVREKEKYTITIAIIIVCSGVLTGHGFPQAFKAATLEVGEEVDRHVYDYPFYPDHKTPGEFVRSKLAREDIVVAEDPLQQRWYVGRADYWLRNPADAKRFVYKAADGELRDIYVNSRLLEDTRKLRALAAEARGRVWIITSGETYPRRDYYLSAEQRSWLESFESALLPVFVGKDKATKVFCVNCSVGKLRNSAVAPPHNLTIPDPLGGSGSIAALLHGIESSATGVPRKSSQ